MTPRERLIRLAEVLEARPAEDPHFDLSIYAVFRGCHTTACAIGWGALDPILMKEGLRLTSNGQNVVHAEALPKTGAGAPQFDGEPSTKFYARFFGLDDKRPRQVPEGVLRGDFPWLFTHLGYSGDQRTPRHVATRIREFCNEYL